MSGQELINQKVEDIEAYPYCTEKKRDNLEIGFSEKLEGIRQRFELPNA